MTVLLLLLITAQPVNSFVAVSKCALATQQWRILTFPKGNGGVWKDCRHHVVPSSRFHRHPRQHESLFIRTLSSSSSSSARQSQKRNSNDDDDNQDEVSGFLKAIDAFRAFLSRPLTLGYRSLQIPTLYPIVLAGVAIMTNLVTFSFFTGTFIGFAYIGRRIVSRDDDVADDNEFNDPSNLLFDNDSIFVPTDIFALLGAIVTTGLLAPPSVSSPTFSIVALDATVTPSAPLPTVAVVLVLLAGLIGFSSSFTRFNRDEENGSNNTNNDDNDDDAFSANSPDQQLMDLWDEKFDQNLKRPKK